MDYLTFYIYPEALILLPTLYFIGLILDQTPILPRWSHAWIKLIFAVVACLIYFGVDIRFVVQGILVTGTEMIFRDAIHDSIIDLVSRYSKNETKEEQDEYHE
ncbi:phage holin family protein [Oceanobacillus senegalensis]|uniref:phage holin family protein n=1 Tax=Oceanobacillus senegalensis TaxID=1936063 RepID=UPI000A30EC36|nr:phage holin family protein [Oceanobacillus senegalensis]